MRSSTAIALDITASAAPAFSVPLPQGEYTYDLYVRVINTSCCITEVFPHSTARDILSERDLVELFARAQAELPQGDESGAINWLKAAGTVFKGAKALFGGK